jgi:hexosaminidase
MPNNCPVIPQPAQFQTMPGSFLLSAETIISTDQLNQWNAAYLRDQLTIDTGITLPMLEEANGHRSVIRLRLGGDRSILGHEGYTLTVTTGEVDIQAPEPAGVFYGIQSLIQLVHLGIKGSLVV